MANGDKYIGEWRDGEKSGKGIYYFSHGDTYDGVWLGGMRHGYGKY